jgi:hypothetical protein
VPNNGGSVPSGGGRGTEPPTPLPPKPRTGSKTGELLNWALLFSGVSRDQSQ